MRRPPLTKNVLEGLENIATFVEAGSSVDILGYEYDLLDKDQKRDWDNMLKACDWIRGISLHKDQKK